jgi:hypothetical protein
MTPTPGAEMSVTGCHSAATQSSYISSPHANITGAAVDRVPELESKNRRKEVRVANLPRKIACVPFFADASLRDGAFPVPSTQRYRISTVYSINRTNPRLPQVLGSMNSPTFSLSRPSAFKAPLCLRLTSSVGRSWSVACS